MTDEDLNTRRKRLMYRSWHRGNKEMDLFLGAFARETLPKLDQAGLDHFEAMLELEDVDLYAWISLKEEVPDDILENPMTAALLKYQLTEADIERN